MLFQNIINLTWQTICNWAYFQCCKSPNIEYIILSSDHTGHKSSYPLVVFGERVISDIEIGHVVAVVVVGGGAAIAVVCVGAAFDLGPVLRNFFARIEGSSLFIWAQG